MVGHRNITRRDFMNGCALGMVAGSLLSPMEAAAYLNAAEMDGRYYPPKLTGMRGNHEGSFEVAHAVARAGRDWEIPNDRTDHEYDLIVIGGGISGLSAAWLYRARKGPDARILILDNHDDFGGHAKRNEFDVDGKKLICYGGSIGIESPSRYSAVSAQLLKDLSIHVERFSNYYDQEFNRRWGLEKGIYFNQHGYGVDLLTPDPFDDAYYSASEADPHDAIGAFPLSDATRDALIQALRNDEDRVGEMPDDQKLSLLERMSYLDYLRRYFSMPAEGTEFLRDKVSKAIWAIGWDRLSALEAARLGMPGTGNWGLSDEQMGYYVDEPFIHQFPDGNASIARALVRSLVPEALPGNTMEDLVTARADYAQLDRAGSSVRIRLNSTVVDVRHTTDESAVGVTYVLGGKARRVIGKHAILACYNKMIPHICSEVPDTQVEAINYASKAPLVYIKIALHNWRAWADAGYNRLYIPKAEMMNSIRLEYPVSIGDYKFSTGPDQPIVAHGLYVPTASGQGLTAREQFRIGRQKLFQLRFSDFEADVVSQLNGAFGKHGFDGDRDIAAITVNRWSHGYADEYPDISDPVEYGPNFGPHIAGRAQIGRISIANSDASARAYADGAIDAAARAVDEQVAFD